MMTPRPDTQLCIATGQNLANLIPALQLKASKVIVLETQQMLQQARHLQRALESHGIKVVREAFDDSTPSAVEQSAEKISFKYGEKPLVFNATGGHKLMTLALAKHLTVADELHVLYTETRHLRLDWLAPAAELQPMQNTLSINDFLMAQGYSRKTSSERNEAWQERALQRAELTRLLGDDSDKYANFFGVLNGLAAAASAVFEKNKDTAPYEQQFQFTPGGRNADLLNKAQQLGLLVWDQDEKIQFKSLHAASYLGGGWMEEYVWLKLRGIKPYDSAANLVVIETGSQAPENELDAVVVHNNRMMIIECKTRSYGKDASKDADNIYKLAQLSRKIGGELGASLLVSARKLDPATEERAKRYGVSVLAGADVKRVSEFVRDWMKIH